MTVSTVAHHAALAVSVAALSAAGIRVASLACQRGLERAIAAVVLAAAAAAAEALALGLIGLGGSSTALLAGALATWVASRLALPAPALPPSRELAGWWSGLGPGEAAAVAAATGASCAWTAWLLWHPALGQDMVAYYLPEAVRWVQGGHPGSELTVSLLPVGAYPLAHVVLLEWGMALGRSFVWVSLVTAAVPVLLAVSVWAALRCLSVDRVVRGLAATALVAVPAVIASQSGGASLDPAALAWLAACAALAAGAAARPAALGPAIVAAGMAVGTKTTALPLAVVVLALGGFAARRHVRSLVPGLLAATALGLVVGGFWYLRNLVDHGSPFWPFASAPWGDPRPALIERLDVRFIDRPGAALSRLGTHYWHHFGGPLILLGGAVAVVIVTRSRAVAAAAAAAFLSVALWMDAPFTGVLPTRELDAATADTARYVLPGIAAAALAIALASRSRAARPFALGLLGIAAAVSLFETFDLGFPSAPRPWVPVAGALLGACAAAVVVRGRVRPPPRVAAAAAALAVAAVGGALVADGYVRRHGDTHIRESRVASWMSRQRSWREGHAPVASTIRLLGPLAGDRLQHPLVLISGRAACTHARSLGAWLVLDLKFRLPAEARDCGPAPYDDGDFGAYRPPG